MNEDQASTGDEEAAPEAAVEAGSIPEGGASQPSPQPPGSPAIQPLGAVAQVRVQAAPTSAPLGQPGQPALIPQPVAPAWTPPIPPSTGKRARIPGFAMLIGVFVGTASVIGFGVIAAIAAGVMLVSEGGSPMDETALREAVTRFPVVAASVVLTLIALSGTALLVAKFSKTSIREGLGFRPAPPLAFVLAPVGIIALGPTSDLCVTFMATYFPELSLGALDQLADITKDNPFWMLWPFIALCPGFSEEIFFRGMIQRSLGFRKRAIVISAVGFAFFHMDPHHIAGVLPLGFYLAWLGHRTGSLWVPVAAHVGNNTMALLGSQLDVESLDVGHGAAAPMPFWWAPVGWAICGAVVAAIWYLTRDQERWLGPAARQDAGEKILPLSTTQNLAETFE